MEGRKGRERNVLFNDALNTFYLRLYGVRHMVKDHSNSEKGNPLPPHGVLFPISSKGSFTYTIPQRIAHTTAFVTPVVEHWLELEIAQWVRHEWSIRWHITSWANALTTELHLARGNISIHVHIMDVNTTAPHPWNKSQKLEGVELLISELMGSVFDYPVPHKKCHVYFCHMQPLLQIWYLVYLVVDLFLFCLNRTKR